MVPQEFLTTLGGRVRAARLARGWSQRELCAASGLSPRFLVQVEQGEGNPSVLRLAELAEALGVSLAALVAGLGPAVDDVDRLAAAVRELPEGRRADWLRAMTSPGAKVALVGLRGAGKSTVGQALAGRLGWAFVELDRRVEDRAGMRLAEVFEFHGAERYRELARRALGEVLDSADPSVIEVGGSLVADPVAWEEVRRGCRVVWLRASPEEHLERVRAQGDLRPMAGRVDALGELRQILVAREPLYRMAHEVVSTQGRPVEGVVEDVLARLGRGAWPAA